MLFYMRDFLIFGLKMASASIFGGVLLFFMVITQFWYPLELHRFDFLFIVAVITQLILIASRQENLQEVKVILIFHGVATAMEYFKTHPAIGSWSYPGADEAIFSLGNVPLFAGFMYSAVGSFIARSWRILDLTLRPFPNPYVTLALSLLIYVNFFTHHFFWDLRYILLAGSVVFFGRTMIDYTVTTKIYRMPFMLAGGLTAFFIWIAENIGTLSSAWLYPEQQSGWQLVDPAKMLSWYLLLLLSFGLVSLLYHKPARTHD